MAGGGSLPEQRLPSRLVAIDPQGHLEDLAGRLRLGNPPLIARIEQDELLIDLRTVFAEQDSLLPELIRQALMPKD